MSTPVVPGASSGQEIQELLDRVTRTLERIWNKAQELVDTINRTLSRVPSLLIPDFLVERVQAGINRMYELLSEAARKVQEYLQSPGWPPALYDAGDRWVSGVARPSADTEAKINADRLNVDNYWRGPAAEAYASTLGNQQAAFAAMVEVARLVKENLHSAARGVIGFWVAVAGALVILVGGIITAIGLALGVITMPASPVAAVTGVLGFIGALGTAVYGAYSYFQDVADDASRLREESQFNTAFDGDEWPRATTAGEWQAD